MTSSWRSLLWIYFTIWTFYNNKKATSHLHPKLVITFRYDQLTLCLLLLSADTFSNNLVTDQANETHVLLHPNCLKMHFRYSWKFSKTFILEKAASVKTWNLHSIQRVNYDHASLTVGFRVLSCSQATEGIVWYFCTICHWSVLVMTVVGHLQYSQNVLYMYWLTMFLTLDS